jgi:hypothetical protein
MRDGVRFHHEQAAGHCTLRVGAGCCAVDGFQARCRGWHQSIGTNSSDDGDRPKQAACCNVRSKPPGHARNGGPAPSGGPTRVDDCLGAAQRLEVQLGLQKLVLAPQVLLLRLQRRVGLLRAPAAARSATMRSRRAMSQRHRNRHHGACRYMRRHAAGTPCCWYSCHICHVCLPIDAAARTAAQHDGRKGAKATTPTETHMTRTQPEQHTCRPTTFSARRSFSTFRATLSTCSRSTHSRSTQSRSTHSRSTHSLR